MSFKHIECKCNVYRGTDSMKMFWEFLREHAMGIINYKNENEIINK